MTTPHFPRPEHLQLLSLLADDDYWYSRQEIAESTGWNLYTTRARLVRLEGLGLVERRDRIRVALGRNGHGWPHEWRTTPEGLRFLENPSQLPRKDRAPVVNGIRIWQPS